MTPFAGQKLLIVPLDWGLGHATRCIPVINAFLKQDCKIWLAGEGAQEVLLRKEFPELPFLPLKGYRIRYSSSGMLGKMLWQVPKILKAIKAENTWLKEKIEECGFDAVISDNRYGLYHKTIKSIFITHQLIIKSPLGKWNEKILQQQNYSYINRFSECWVPDYEGDDNLAGELSHPVSLPQIPLRYIGPLSRFEKNNTVPEKDKVLIILSGPEPQRTVLEKKILNELKTLEKKVTIIRGLPSEKENPATNKGEEIINHLPAAALLQEIENAEWVISRSGYSTVMDLIKLKKKTIMIPTPGQTEQEYLGRYLMEKGKIFSVVQKDFTLNESLQKAANFNYLF